MQKNKKVYDTIVAKFGIYLPTYHLNKLMVKHEGATSPIVKEVNKNPKLQKYTNPEKGAFSNGVNQEEHLESVRKAVISIHPVSYKMIEYTSLYQAAKAVGKPKGFGNIHRAITQGNMCYGLKWKLK